MFTYEALDDFQTNRNLINSYDHNFI